MTMDHGHESDNTDSTAKSCPMIMVVSSELTFTSYAFHCK